MSPGAGTIEDVVREHLAQETEEKKVYIVVGWFGDHEWIECVCATEERADKESSLRWETRNSANTPEWAKGLGKFGVEEHVVLGA